MPSISLPFRSGTAKKYSAAGIATASAAAVALSLVPGSADAGDASQSSATKASATPVAFTGEADRPSGHDSIARQVYAAQKHVQEKTESKQAAQAEKRAEAKAESQREAKLDASRDAQRRDVKKPESKPAKKTYPDNLDGWIREAMAIMDKHNIPGSYEGIHRNIIRESGGDPNAVNDWDINAQKGTPSKGLLQTIRPTFEAYHVPGTSSDMTDPVANIVAACNYAADRYGSMDNVDSAY